MGQQVTCPTCFKGIPSDQIFDQMTVCECGQVIHLNNHKHTRGNSKPILLIVLLSLFILGSFVHAVNWDKYSLTILPLKTKQILGLANLNDYKEVANICKIRKKYFCQEQALSSASKLDPKNLNHLLEIGQLQVNREAYHLAVRTYSSYFTAKGLDKEARLNLAIALDKTGHTKDAKRHLKYLVYSNKKDLQANAARTYVSILMKSGDLQEAQKVIRFCRGVGNNASLFMEKEFKQVSKLLVKARSA